jgi:hypothetical protein
MVPKKEGKKENFFVILKSSLESLRLSQSLEVCHGVEKKYVDF